MSNPSNEMPEKIYAAQGQYGTWWNEDKEKGIEIEYIRADLVQPTDHSLEDAIARDMYLKAQPTDDARAIDNLPKLSFYARGVYEQRKKACIPQRYDHADDALELIENEKLRKSHDARAKALADMTALSGQTFNDPTAASDCYSQFLLDHWETIRQALKGGA